MTPVVFATIRQQLGLTRAQFARALGYTGNDNTCHKQIWEMENGKKPIRAAIATAAVGLLGARQAVSPDAN